LLHQRSTTAAAIVATLLAGTCCVPATAQTGAAPASAAAAPAVAAAPAAPPAPAATALPALTNSATRTSRRVHEVPATVSVRNAREIEAAGARDIKDLFRHEVDISVRAQPGRFGMAAGPTGRAGTEGINIRGLEGNQVLMLVDGIRVPGSFSLGLRLMAQQQHVAAALEQAKAEIARLRGELARRVTTEVSAPAYRAEPDSVRPAATPAAAMAPARAPVIAQARPAVSAAASAAVVVGPSVQSGAAVAPPITVHGRRVLCVGGIQHAVARYRSRVERLGGLFDHHDGGLEDNLQALDGRLRRAELVICQAACINHEAYHRIKRHCERTGTPCLYLERPSLSRFDRALHGIAAAQSGAPPMPSAPLRAVPERRP